MKGTRRVEDILIIRERKFRAKMACVCVCSVVSDSVAIPQTVPRQAPVFMEFFQARTLE